MKTELIPVPTWALGYLINGDETGLEFGEKEMIDDWLKKEGILDVIPTDDPEGHTYFTHFPPFGLGCDVEECECVLEW